MYQNDPSLHIVPPSEGLHVYKADTRPRGWRTTPATDRQASVLDGIKRDLEMLPVQPSPALKDLYRDIGPEGLEKAKAALAECYKSAGKASTVIDHKINRTLTYVVRHLLS